MAAKTIFGYCAIMLIYANKLEKDRVDSIVGQLEKITVKKSASESSKMREKQILGP